MVDHYFRVDPRLVHATVMNAWVPELRVQRLVVVDDDVYADMRRRTILSMSAMEEVAVQFAKSESASELLVDGPVALVLFSDLDGVRRAIDCSLELDELNVGHLPAADGASAIHPAVHLGPDDLHRLTTFQAQGTRVYLQPLPNDPPIAPFGIPRPVQVRRPGRRAEPVRAPGPAGTARASVEVVNERGLHLRAAHVLAAEASRIEGEVRVGREGQMVNAKSLLGLTTLGAHRGSRLDVEVSGTDAEASLRRLVELFANGFTEGAAS